jgi:hypothetical protein
MKIDGLAIQQAIKVAKNNIEILEVRYKNNLFTFPSEKADDVIELSDNIETMHLKFSTLHELQQAYNLHVFVTIDETTMTLSKAVKLVPGYAKLASMWKSAALDKDNRSFGAFGRQTSRSKDDEYIVRTISVDKCIEMSRKYDDLVIKLRNAIARGNVTEVTLGYGEFSKFSPSCMNVIDIK